MSEKENEQQEELEATPAETANHSSESANELQLKAKNEVEPSSDPIQSDIEIAPKPDEDTPKEVLEEPEKVHQKFLKGMIPWVVDPEHKTAVKILSEKTDSVNILVYGDVQALPSRAFNFLLLLLIMGVGSGGIIMLEHYSSADREARLMEVGMCKIEMDQKKTLLGATKYGTLRIESEPKQALIEISIDGSEYKASQGKTPDGKIINTKTPATLSNLDINKKYKFRLTFTETLKRFKEDPEAEKKKKAKDKKDKKDKKDDKDQKDDREVEELKVDYRTEEFHVSRYQWIQDGGTGSYRFQKTINLVQKEDLYAKYLTMDWKTGKDQEFETESECKGFVSGNDATTCQRIQRVKNFETEDARKEEEAKGKKGKRRRGR